ncbi:iron ABC transporter substrate-binding protein [Micromonospora sp. NPDC049679]|uniref:iron ABC transporter substrate-binding protein n=1 Tax=Micromonospora sp. NPDC049679 TaxID=3155920 RepID=UPI0033EA0D2F
MPISRLKGALALTAAAALTLGLAACGDDAKPAADADGSASDKKITLYSGRSEKLIKPLLEKFTQQTGIAVEARYGNTAQMAAQLLEEGAKSPADLFFAQDAGALGAVNKKNLFAAVPSETLNKVPQSYRAKDGKWIGVTARSRVLVYNPALAPAADLPKSVFELTDPKWKGKIGVAPTNASFQAFVTAITVQHGEAKAREFLKGLKANEPQIRDGNGPILEEVDAGKIAVGLINHYYAGEIAKERGVAPESLKAKLHFFPNGDTGALVNVAGVGVLNRAVNDADVRTFLDYVLGTEAQKYFAEQTYEYPVVAGVAGPTNVPPLAELTAPPVDLNDLDGLQATIGLIKESGLTP